MSTRHQKSNLLASIVSIAMAQAVLPAHANTISFSTLSGTALAAPMPGAPLNGKNLAVMIVENGSEVIKSVSVNGTKVTQNMDKSWTIGPFGSIQLGMVNVGDPEDNTSVSDTIDIRKGAGTIVITNMNKGFTSDDDANSPAEANEMAKVPNGTATATYTISSPAEVPEPASLVLLGSGLMALCALHGAKKH